MSKPPVDFSKVVFNPSKSFTFQPVQRKQQAALEISNNSEACIHVKFKNTNPTLLMTHPKEARLKKGTKQKFSCYFKGAPKEKCKPNERFTVVLAAISENVRAEKVKEAATKADCRKHAIQIVFVGINDQKEKEKETQQPTNAEEDEDKDRQGQMRSKSKVETAKIKKPIVMMFTRKEGESISDEEDEESGTVPVGEAPRGDDMMTTRPAGNFTGQVVSNVVDSGNPDNMRTTRPAGAFTGQVASNEIPGGPANPKSEFKTTRPAGTFNGQVASNPTPGTPVDAKSAGMLTTRPAGAFNGQVTANATSRDNQDLKTTKPAGSYDNPQRSNK